jgi:hypothetical protein
MMDSGKMDSAVVRVHLFVKMGLFMKAVGVKIKQMDMAEWSMLTEICNFII